MMVSTAVMMVIVAGVFSLLNPTYGTFQAQPEVSDMQQRMRVAADTIQKDLVMAGAGMYSGGMVGTLDAYFSPLLPHKVGTISPDPAGTFHSNPLCPTTCTSAVTIMYVPTTTAQTTITTDMPTPSAELKVAAQSGCPAATTCCAVQAGHARPHHEPRRGLRHLHDHPGAGRRAPPAASRRQVHDGYPAGSFITQIVSHTYYLEDNGNDTFRLRHYDGFQSDLPLVDNVVDFRVEFFGDPSPPQVLKPATDADRAMDHLWPQAAGSRLDNGKDKWSAGENCIFSGGPGHGLQVAAA
jgi:hypothetical protein